MDIATPKCSYYVDKKGCRRAVISCLTDNEDYFMAVEDKDNILQYISCGKHIERVVNNKKGKFDLTILTSGDDVTFSKVVCLKQVFAK